MTINRLLIISILLVSMMATLSPLSAADKDLQADIDSLAGTILTYADGDFDSVDTSVSIDKSLTLQCIGGYFDTSITDPSLPVFEITNSNEQAITVTIEKFEIYGGSIGIHASGNVILNIVDCIIHDNSLAGIKTENGVMLTVTDSIFYGVDGTDPIDTSNIYLYNSDATIENCIFGKSSLQYQENIGIYALTENDINEIYIAGNLFINTYTSIEANGYNDAAVLIEVTENTIQGATLYDGTPQYGMVCSLNSAQFIGGTIDSNLEYNGSSMFVYFSENDISNIKYGFDADVEDYSLLETIIDNNNFVSYDAISIYAAHESLVDTEIYNNTITFPSNYTLVNPQNILPSESESVGIGIITENNAEIMAFLEDNAITGYLYAIRADFGENLIEQSGAISANDIFGINNGVDLIQTQEILNNSEIGISLLFIVENAINAYNGISVNGNSTAYYLIVYDNTFTPASVPIQPNRTYYDGVGECAISVSDDSSVSLCEIENNHIESYVYGIKCQFLEIIYEGIAAGDASFSNDHYVVMGCNTISNCVNGIEIDQEYGYNYITYLYNNLICDGILPVYGEISGSLLDEPYGISLTYSEVMNIDEGISVVNNTLANLYGGCNIVAPNDYVSIVNNIIASSSTCGLKIEQYIALDSIQDNQILSYEILCNDIWNNGTNYCGVADQTYLNGNISCNPLFSAGYMLDDNSPCIDAGINNYNCPDYDILHVERPQDEEYDIGAYEQKRHRISPEGSFAPIITNQLATINSTLSIVMASLSENPSPDTQLLLDEIQGILDGISLSNSIQATGKLSRAIELLGQIQ